ncbi:TRAF3-interacting protein 1-like isoform X1 [Saccostrea echinata]|uniref:TRAF3-interacting protein 1-like isoform X1 n=1 Tax=Saccostrea echinata TaxID=191078 RepID=UPI002A7F4787|nr:TRAF3-interacting protein 1-like isoform X1 [Saccostrea echinata]
MDARIVKKTQDTLGKIIKKPPLTEKLLNKPPFRFLHDIVTSVIKTTGFMNGLFKEEELNSENVKDKDSKIAFLQKAIDFTSMVAGKSLSVKPAKIVAGHEPEKTNEFLQTLAAAINKGVDNDEYVAKMNKGGGEPKEEKRDKSKEGSREERKKRDSEDKKDRDKSASREKSRERHRDKEERHKDREDRHRDKEDRHRDDEDRHREKKDRHRDKEGRHRDKEDRDGEKEERHKDREERHRERKERRKHQDEESKENDPSQMNGEKEESPTKLARPSSAKGSRRRREGRRHSSDEEDEPPKTMQASEAGDDNLPPQVSASRSLARPSSARPAPPRRKQEVMENEPAMRLGSGKPSNVIVDGGRDSDEDEDETFMVEETAAPQEQEQAPPPQQEEDEDEDHGGLVKKMLETKKELESGSQVKKTEIERPKITDAQRMKQRQQVQKEIDKLRVSIQTLTRSANPLGKVMDYVQEDLDSMQKELQRWKQENKEHSMELKRERSITDKAIEPLRAQLTEVDQAIKDQLDLIAAVKSNIIRNDQKIDKMLRSIAKS